MGSPETPDPNSILVIGAGELGSAMVQALHEHPHPFSISVLLRASTIASTDATKAATNQRLRNLGATLVAGDFATDAEASLAATFARFHTVVCCAGFTYGAGGVQTRITRAVLAAQVPRYVPWQFGVDYDVLGAGSAQDSFDEQLAVRALLRAPAQTRTAWVVVSVGVFMSFLFEGWWGVVDLEADTVRALGGWDTRITTTAPEDIGRVTAEILAAREPEVRDEVCFVAGETLTYGRLADAVERAAGRKLRRELWDMPFLMRELAADPDNGLKKYRPIFAGDKGIAWDYESSWNGKRGIRTTTTEEYARRLISKKEK